MNVFLILFIITVLGFYFLIHNYNTQNIIKNTALIVDISGIIVDKITINNKINQLSYELLGITKNRLQENSLFDIVNILRQAKNDPNITGIILSLKKFKGTDQTSLQYIGKILKEIKNKNKMIFAISDQYSQAQYFLASYANKIYLLPHGSVDLYGISTNNLYYKTFLEKLKISTNVFRIGKYKSAVEPFLRDNMSEEAKYVERCWLEQLWQNYLDTIANNRKTNKQLLFPNADIIIKNLQKVHGDTAKYALNNKLIDEIISYAKFENKMTKIFGINKKNNSFNSISIYDYQINTKIKQIKNQIAVIFVNGIITDGYDGPGIAGSETIINKIRDARLNPNIKAIILRINSPGGNVNSSELISAELSLTKKSGKPIIVSMGGMAASGGYWISVPATIIIADNNTLTGSIGIFGIINTFEKSLDSIGIHADGISTSPLAGISINKKLTNEYIQMMNLYINKGYENFINIVAKSRNKTPEEIEHIAQGRIWIGSDALQKGLIDYLGDFDDAVQKAVELTNIKKYQLNWYLEEPNLLNTLITKINESSEKTISHFILTLLNFTNKKYQLTNTYLNTNLDYYKDPHDCYAIYYSNYTI